MKTLGYTTFDPGPMSLESQIKQFEWVFDAPDVYVYKDLQSAQHEFARDAKLPDDAPCIVWSSGISQIQVMFDVLRNLHVHHVRHLGFVGPITDYYEYMRWAIDLYLSAGAEPKWRKISRVQLAERDPRSLGDVAGSLKPKAPDTTDPEQWRRMTRYPSDREDPPRFSWNEILPPVPTSREHGNRTGVTYHPSPLLSSLRNLVIYPNQRMSEQHKTGRVLCRPLPEHLFPHLKSGKVTDHMRPNSVITRVTELIRDYNIPILTPIVNDTNDCGSQAEDSPAWVRFMMELTRRAMGKGTVAVEYCVDKDAPIYKLERRFGTVINNFMAAPDFFPVQNEFRRALHNHVFEDDAQRDKFTEHVLANELEQACALIKL